MMEVIQEYSENRYYLAALSTSGRVEVSFNVAEVSQKVADERRKEESPERVFNEPLGRLFFRHHLMDTNNHENWLVINQIEEYEKLPMEGKTAQYRTRRARQLINTFFKPGCKQQVSCYPAFYAAMCQRFAACDAAIGPPTDLFTAAKKLLEWHLKLSCFPSFLTTKYYRRLLGFREHGRVAVKTSSFEFLRVLGEGGFGKVFAVSKRDTRAVYACKTISKQKIAERQREKLIMNERHILALMNHPFIVSMKYAFQDDQALHLVLDLMSGGELQFHLNRFGFLSESYVEFYAACLVLAIGYLHSKEIVYRDLKPENIMIDADGFVRLTDLGLCSFIKRDTRLHRHCGTRSYMAPEQCTGPQGYGKPVDWWSLGVTILHLLTGKNPFTKKFRKQHQDRKRRQAMRDAAAGVRSTTNALQAHRASDVRVNDGNANGGNNGRIDDHDHDHVDAIAHTGNIIGDAYVNGTGLGAQQRPSSPSVAVGGTASGVDMMVPGMVNSPSEVAAIAAAPAGGSPGRAGPLSPHNNLPSSPGEILDPRDKENKRGDRKIQQQRRYNDLVKEYSDVLTSYRFPESVSPAARSLCEMLLQVDDRVRLGARGFEEVKAHPFFARTDWNKLMLRSVSPPFIPDSNYVNADYLEATTVGLSRTKKSPKMDEEFKGFDYINPTVFQEEVFATLHDKVRLVYANGTPKK